MREKTKEQSTLRNRAPEFLWSVWNICDERYVKAHPVTKIFDFVCRFVTARLLAAEICSSGVSAA